jgi:uncharacterized protein YjiS (DUF1127 family)
MTDLRSVLSDFYSVFQLPPGQLVPLNQPDAGRVLTQVIDTVFSAALGPILTGLRDWRQAGEARHARHHLMQLDDHLLSDIGLNRTDVCFGDFETLGLHRRAGGIR